MVSLDKNRSSVRYFWIVIVILIVGFTIFFASNLYKSDFEQNEKVVLHDEIPDQYDLRDYNLITPVKEQNGQKPDGSTDLGTTVGLCWSFASLSSLESNMLKQNIVKSPENSEVNFSPWYLGNYIGYNSPCYEHNSNIIPNAEPSTSFGYYSFDTSSWGGAGSSWVADYLISGKKLPLWKDSPMPYSDMNAKRTLAKPEPDLGKQYIIDSMQILFRDDFDNKNEYYDSIKKYILKHGAIQSFIHLEVIDTEGIEKEVCNGATYTGHRFMDKQNYNLYTYTTDNLCTSLYTHAVAIAGWDDNRKIEIDGHKTTGAWLIKDSMGQKAYDNGYFWVAYDDQVLLTYFASGIIASKNQSYKHPSFYQTHSGGLSESDSDDYEEDSLIELGNYNYLLNGFKDKNSWGFAEFELKNNETLKAIGIFTSNPDEKVTVNVYKNSVDSEVLFSKEFEVEYAGYHILDFQENIFFKKGEVIVVGIGFENSERSKLPLVYTKNNNYNYTHSTYYATYEDNKFELNKYSDFCENCSLYMQAIVSK